MLDWERWTLTHSSGEAGALVLLLPGLLLLLLGLGLGLGLLLALGLPGPLGLLLVSLLLGLGLGLGLVATEASSVAAVVPAAADVPDLDGEDDAPPWSREGDGRADREGDGEAVGRGLRVVRAEGDDAVGGSPAGEVWVAGGLVAGEGSGEGVGVPEAGRAWHTVSVFAVVAIGAACASASRPRVRKLPLSKVTAATLTCAKRIRIACLRCSSGLPCALRDSEATQGWTGMSTHIR
jgi:hypothetical protein